MTLRSSLLNLTSLHLVIPVSPTVLSPRPPLISLSDQRSYLEKAAAVLDYATFRSKHKYQLRILLINIYRLLGASSLALSHYRQLGVKSVQFDTLSHLVLGRASTFSVASGNDPGVLQEATIASNWYGAGEVEAR